MPLDNRGILLRCDGMMRYKSALTPYAGAQTLSPAIPLAIR